MINYNKSDDDLRNKLLTHLHNNMKTFTYSKLLFIHINIRKDQILYGHIYANNVLTINYTKLESTFEEGVYYFDKPLDIDLFDASNLNKYRILYEPKGKEQHKNSIVYNKTNNTYKLMNNVYDKLEIDFSEKNLNLIDGL